MQRDADRPGEAPAEPVGWSPPTEDTRKVTRRPEQSAGRPATVDEPEADDELDDRPRRRRRRDEYDDDDRSLRRVRRDDDDNDYDIRRRFRCVRCGSSDRPIVRSQMSQAGLITLILLLVFCWPLFWIGLLMNENVSVCADCGAKQP